MQQSPPKRRYLVKTARAWHHHRESLKCQDGMMIVGNVWCTCNDSFHILSVPPTHLCWLSL
jgi:hypothetical protein